MRIEPGRNTVGINIHTNLWNLTQPGASAADGRSRISQAEMAAEAAIASRNQILRQPGLAILAQANSQPLQAISLLLDG